MKFKKLAQMVLIGCGLLALTSCSTTGNNSDEAAVSDAGAGGAEMSGAGQGAGFGGEGNLTPEQLLAKRTYYFEYDSNAIRDEDKAAIEANAHYLVSHADAKIVLEGHTDPRGSREYNVALGERRANAVADMLKSKGVNPDQIRVVSYGAERLAVPGHTEQDYQLDRRAVIVMQR